MTTTTQNMNPDVSLRKARKSKRIKFVIKITIPIGIIFFLIVNYLKTYNNPLGIGYEVIVQNAVASDGKKGVFLRENPGRGNAPVGAVFNGATGTIMKGPETEDDHRWWKVQWDVDSEINWSPEYPCNQSPCEAWIAEKVNGVAVLAKRKQTFLSVKGFVNYF